MEFSLCFMGKLLQCSLAHSKLLNVYDVLRATHSSDSLEHQRAREPIDVQSIYSFQCAEWSWSEKLGPKLVILLDWIVGCFIHPFRLLIKFWKLLSTMCRWVFTLSLARIWFYSSYFATMIEWIDMVSDCVKNADGDKIAKNSQRFPLKCDTCVCGSFYRSPFAVTGPCTFLISDHFTFPHFALPLTQKEVMTPIHLQTPITFISHRKVHDIISIAWNQITWVHFSLSLTPTTFHSRFQDPTPSNVLLPLTFFPFVVIHWRFPQFSHHIWWLMVYSFPSRSSAITLHTVCTWVCECAILRYYPNDFPFVFFRTQQKSMCFGCGACGGEDEC